MTLTDLLDLVWGWDAATAAEAARAYYHTYRVVDTDLRLVATLGAGGGEWVGHPDRGGYFKVTDEVAMHCWAEEQRRRFTTGQNLLLPPGYDDVGRWAVGELP